MKLWIDPFYRLTRRNPPLWFSRLLLAAMIEVYHSWNHQLKQLNEPFYLKMWIYNPHFINSQIVVAFRECLHYYDNTFDKSNDNQTFPSHLYGKIPSLQQFEWELTVDSDKYWLSELQADIQLGIGTVGDIEAVKNKAYKTETMKLSYGWDTIFNVKVGDVWLGEIIK